MIRKTGKTLGSADEWLQEAPPPAEAAPWEAGQAEFELARALFRVPGKALVPDELQALLASHSGLGPLRLVQGIPGYLVRLDDQPGGSQRCDLLGVVNGREGRGAVVIEASGDMKALDQLVERLRPFGITQLVRTGRVALER